MTVTSNTLLLPCGTKYVGTFQRDSMEGKMVIFHPDGSREEGEMQGNAQNGKWVFETADGKKSERLWKDGSEDRAKRRQLA